MATRSEVVKVLNELTLKQLQNLTNICLPPTDFIPFPTNNDKEAIKQETTKRRQLIYQSDRVTLINIVAPAVLRDPEHALENIQLSLQKAENAAKKRQEWHDASYTKQLERRRAVRDYLRNHPEVEEQFKKNNG